MTSSADGRSLRGLSMMTMRPRFICWLEPPTPMNDMVDATCGFSRILATASCCCWYIASKEMSCAASVKANSDPTSSVGRKPLGMVMPR